MSKSLDRMRTCGRPCFFWREIWNQLISAPSGKLVQQGRRGFNLNVNAKCLKIRICVQNLLCFHQFKNCKLHKANCANTHPLKVEQKLMATQFTFEKFPSCAIYLSKFHGNKTNENKNATSITRTKTCFLFRLQVNYCTKYEFMC